MVALRNRPKGGLAAPFGLGILTLILFPGVIGHQELTALVVPQAVERVHAIASPFGTIHAARFSLPRPLRDAMPAPLSTVLAGLDSSNAGITGSIRERM